jgi:S1-C subfamily serine protease
LRRRPIFLSAALAVTVLALPGEASAQGASGPVWCHDAGRDLVRRAAPGDCTGTAVDDAEAARIKAERIERVRRRLQGRAPPVAGQRRRGSGTGFFVSADGHLITNNHVVDGCTAISVAPAGGDEGKAELLAADAGHDLALLKIAARPDGVAAFRHPATLHQGEDIAVVGYPLHGLVTIKPILVTGQVYIGTQPPRADMFAMSIDIRRGNSGGPVLDRSGRIVGVVVAKVNTPGVFAATGQLVRDLGYAIRLPVTVDFLRRHGVAPTPDAAFTDLDDEALFARARAFVARIGCWK